MKKIIYSIITVCLAVCFYACEKDNYDAPNAEIMGRILDHNGKLFQTEQGSSSMRIKMDELSWNTGDEDVAIKPFYLNMKQDGEYINNKIFAAKYNMTPIEGAFYPYTDKDSVIIDIKGVTVQDFTVIPYLDIEWVAEPSLTADNHVVASVRFKRNEKTGVTMPNLNDGALFIASSHFVGKYNHDSQISGNVKAITNADEGTVIEFKSSKPMKYTNATYYVRVGISCADSFKKYNYTDVKSVTVK